MKKALLVLVGLSLILAFAVPAMADKKADAKAMVDECLAMIKAKGYDATVVAIKDPKGPFRKGELYIFVGDTTLKGLVAHPIKPQLEGKDFSKLKDVKGKLFFLEMFDVAKTKGEGWVDYWWPKPGEKKASLKKTWVKAVPGTTKFLGCGIYE